MQDAAHQQILKSFKGGIVDVEQIYRDADAAFEALSTTLDHDVWFFRGNQPSFFDAAVFAYTHLLLSLPVDPSEAHLTASVRRHQNLVDHQDRIARTWY